MRLLAIEATGAAVSVALVEAANDGRDRVVACTGIDGPGTSDRLIQLVDALLPPDDGGIGAVDMIAVDRGPGGFTAVRAAVAAARGLALAVDRPLLPLTAFEVLAAAAGDAGGTVLAAIDTRRGTVRLQAFTGDADPLMPPRDAQPEEALHGLARPLTVVGSGCELVLAAAADKGGVTALGVTPDARVLGLLAARRLRQGLAPAPPFTVEPLYLRPPDARPPRRLIERPDAASSDHAGPQA